MTIYTGKGINAQRKLFSDRSSHDAEIDTLLTQAPPQVLYRAVVVDVLFDPANMLDEVLKKYGAFTEDNEGNRSVILNRNLLISAPRNSVLARIITNAADKRFNRPHLFYPLFSHIHMPIKPGEKIWVVYESTTPVSYDLGYWVSRIVERRDVDDPNFTHGDRAFVDEEKPLTIDKALNEVPDNTPVFSNGSNTMEGLSLASPDDYEKIDKNAIANKIVTKEPVPRYSKRPQDWVAEGSNNSLFVLGEDRTSKSAKFDPNISGKQDKDKSSGRAGMFDLVVGRGVGPERKYPEPNGNPPLTSPPVIKNARELLETDKRLSKENKQEGDVDFEYDLTRMYGAMDTDIDGNFGKPLPKLNSGRIPEKVEKGAGAIIKSTHCRVIAREDGTIRIVKEGVEDDESGKGRAVIIIEKDGTIMIDGPKIIVGSGIEKGHGQGAQLYLGRDATEPIVLGDTLKQVLTDYSNEVNTAIDNLNTIIASFTTLGNFGIPIPDLASLKSQYPTQIKQKVNEATSKFQTDLTNALSKIGRTK